MHLFIAIETSLPFSLDNNKDNICTISILQELFFDSELAELTPVKRRKDLGGGDRNGRDKGLYNISNKYCSYFRS